MGLFMFGDRVAYGIAGFGEARGTVQRTMRDGRVVVWPERWGDLPNSTSAGEMLDECRLRLIGGGA